MTDIQAQAGAPDPIDDAMRYLLNGGLFNPEAMNHDQVRDLVMRLRDEVISGRKATAVERAAAERCAGERDHWKANHDNAVALKQAVLDRPDLQDRAQRVQQLIQERGEAIALLQQSSYDIQRHIADKQRLEDHVKHLLGILRDYPTGQDDGTWITRKDAALGGKE